MEEIKKNIERRISLLNEYIAEYNEERIADIEHFLKWNAEKLYKVTMKRDWYDALLVVDDKGIMEETLKHSIEHLTDDILCGGINGSSTNQMANIMHIWNIEVKQELIRISKGLLDDLIMS